MSNKSYHNFGSRRHPDDYRQEEIKLLKQAIQATENRLVLSMPDVGLSNLMRFLVTRSDWGDRKPIFAYLDCDSLDDCLNRKSFFIEVTRQFFEQGVGNRLQEEASGYDRLHRLLHEVGGNRLWDSPLVIVVNKADRMLVSADKAFYRKLKALADVNTRLCYIFAAGLHAANEVDPLEPLFAGRWLPIGRFNRRDLEGAITEEAQRLGREFDSTERKQLTRLTGCHAGLLRAISSAVDDLRLDLSEPKEIQVESLIARGDVQSFCNRIWIVLNPVQQATLHAVASEQPDLAGEGVLIWLRKFDLIEELEGEYRLFSPIFQRFVTTQEVLIETITQTTPLECIKIDKPSTIFKCGQEIVVVGNIFKGDEIVDVSPLELRLIACLKREPRVFTKREVAFYVYCEDYEEDYEQNQPIPPDPRIDNLVRQVRSKLGDGRYIRTHYKRGYEFIDGC